MGARLSTGVGDWRNLGEVGTREGEVENRERDKWRLMAD